MKIIVEKEDKNVLMYKDLFSKDVFTKDAWIKKKGKDWFDQRQHNSLQQCYVDKKGNVTLLKGYGGVDARVKD